MMPNFDEDALLEIADEKNSSGLCRSMKVCTRHHEASRLPTGDDTTDECTNAVLIRRILFSKFRIHASLFQCLSFLIFFSSQNKMVEWNTTIDLQGLL